MCCVAAEMGAWWKSKRGDIGTTSGTLHSTLTVDESVRYIDDVVNTYMRLASRSRLNGPVAELGPGDNLGSLLMLKALGASEVVAIDRHRPRSDPQFQRSIYLELAKRHPDIDTRFDEHGAPAAVITEYGTPAEDYFTPKADSFEGVVSWSVLEHLYDPLSALTSMASALRAGGFLAHSVDLRDHDAFGPVEHPLKFLTIPEAVYPYLVRNRGGPNRVLVHRYREWLAASGCSGSILVHALIGNDKNVGGVPWDEIPITQRQAAVALVRRHRRSFASVFDDVSDEDLAVSGFQLVVHKRGAPA